MQLRANTDNIRINENTFTLSGFLQCEEKKESATSEPSLPPPPAPSQASDSHPDYSNAATGSNAATVSSSLATYISKNDVLKAEILWTLKIVTAHFSYRSCKDSNQLFQAMFPDSAIAQKFTCGEKKAAYMCVFGLGDFFRNELRKNITGHFVILFDESLNKKSQKKQMDIHIRYWVDGVQVTTRFLDSVFLGKFNNLIWSFNCC